MGGMNRSDLGMSVWDRIKYDWNFIQHPKEVIINEVHDKAIDVTSQVAATLIPYVDIALILAMLFGLYLNMWAIKKGGNITRWAFALWLLFRVVARMVH